MDSDRCCKTIPLDNVRASGHHCTEALSRRLFCFPLLVCHVVYRDAVGVAVESSESISNSFILVQDMCGADLNVKLHVLEIGFNKADLDRDKVLLISKLTLRYFGHNYQCFVVVEEGNSEYRAKYCINACSYNGAGKFVDNNNTYIMLKGIICSMVETEMKFFYDSTVLFNNRDNNIGNYVTVNERR